MGTSDLNFDKYLTLKLQSTLLVKVFTQIMQFQLIPQQLGTKTALMFIRNFVNEVMLKHFLFYFYDFQFFLAALKVLKFLVPKSMGSLLNKIFSKDQQEQKQGSAGKVGAPGLFMEKPKSVQPNQPQLCFDDEEEPKLEEKTKKDSKQCANKEGKNQQHRAQSQTSQSCQKQMQKMLDQNSQNLRKQQTSTLYRDLQNLTGIAFETQAVLDQFSDNPDHPMIQVALNRLACQANISNGIACALNQENEASNEQNLRENMTFHNKQIRSYIQQLQENQKFDKKITEVLVSHEKYSLQDKPVQHQQQIDMRVQPHQSSLNPQLVQQLVSAMIIEDQFDYENFQHPSFEQFTKMNEQRYKTASQKVRLQWFFGTLLNEIKQNGNLRLELKEYQIIPILITFFESLEQHFQHFNQRENYQKIFQSFTNSNSQQQKIIADFFRLMIASNIEGLDIYFFQALLYLQTAIVPEQCTSEIDYKTLIL